MQMDVMQHEEDPGCFDFSCVRPPYCRKYGPYPQAEPYSSNEADPAAGENPYCLPSGNCE